MSKKPETYLYKPSSENYRSIVQFEFLSFIEEQEPRFIQSLREIFNKWKREVITPVYKLAKLEQMKNGLKFVSIKEVIGWELEKTNAQAEKYYKDGVLPKFKMSDYKQILREKGMLKNVNIWIEYWKLEKKGWLYRFVVSKFQFWGEGIKDNDEFYGWYAMPQMHEIKAILPPRTFNLQMWNIEFDSVQEYKKKQAERFKRFLEDFINDAQKNLRAKDYKRIGKPHLLLRNIEWYYLALFKNKTNYEIAKDFWDSENKITETTVERSLQRLERLGDLPKR